MKQSQKLSYLLRLLWNNPIFGDSYPSTVYEEKTLLQIEDIYVRFLTEFRPILAEGMPQASIFELNDIIDQIAPKSIAFCAAISAGEIEDSDRLCDVAMAIAISYWADQSMDRGDEAMLAAIHHINAELKEGGGIVHPVSELVGARLAALRHIESLAQRANDHPEDLPYILRAIYRDVLLNQARMRDLSRQYLTDGGSPAFWDKHAEETARTILDNSGLMSAVTVIYAIYRYHQPDIPSLSEIYHHTELMTLIGGPFNAAIRVFDDLGDRIIDTGQNSQWGIFNLNLFNQPNIKMLGSFIRYSGIEDIPLHDALMEAFTRGDPSSRIYVTKAYRLFLRENIAKLPQPLWEKYVVFLNLCKRTLEAGFVNSVGDILLTEDKGIHTVESEILNLVISGATKPN